MNRNVGGIVDESRKERRKMLVLEIEDKGTIVKLALDEGQICWEGFREVSGKLVRGVPKRGRKDCFKYCRHEGCQFA